MPSKSRADGNKESDRSHIIDYEKQTEILPGVLSFMFTDFLKFRLFSEISG
jgi:hypothetical protein